MFAKIRMCGPWTRAPYKRSSSLAGMQYKLYVDHWDKEYVQNALFSWELFQIWRPTLIFWPSLKTIWIWQWICPRTWKVTRRKLTTGKLGLWWLPIPPCHNKRLSFPGIGIPMLKTRRSRDRLIYNMGIPLLVRRHLYIETAPDCPSDLNAPRSQIHVVEYRQSHGQTGYPHLHWFFL